VHVVLLGRAALSAAQLNPVPAAEGGAAVGRAFEGLDRRSFLERPMSRREEVADAAERVDPLCGHVTGHAGRDDPRRDRVEVDQRA